MDDRKADENVSFEAHPLDVFAAPDSVVEEPPTLTRCQELPFHKLEWQNFERLCFRVAGRNTKAEDWRRYGRQGQAQAGIDIYVRLSDGKYEVWQCKKYKSFGAEEVTEVASLFLDGVWKDRAIRFILCVSSELSDTATQLQIEKEATRLRAVGVVFRVYDSIRFSELLKSYPDLVDDFFGRAWLIAFCGEEAIRGLALENRRLSGEQIAELRRQLSSFYRAYFGTLERGLVQFSKSSLDSYEPPSLLRRFVVPDVLVNEPTYSSATYRYESSKENTGDEDGSKRRNIDAEESNESSSAKLPERSYRRPVDEWLSGGPQTALLGEAGSGKSALLRFLALDLLSGKPTMPQAASAWGGFVPILVPFARWTQMFAGNPGGVSLERVVYTWLESFSAPSELLQLVLEAFKDRRLLLLVDGIDEWVDETVARTVLDQLETTVKAWGIPAIVTGRPLGVNKLGRLSRPWRIAYLAPLSEEQQRKLANTWFSAIPVTDEVDPATRERSVAWQVETFFNDLKETGRLHSLGGTPLLLTGLISLRMRNVTLPRNRFEAYEELTKLLLDIHPLERSSAAADQAPRFRILRDPDIRHRVLGRLAYEILKEGAEGGYPLRDAERVLSEFLRDESEIGFSAHEALEGAREILAVNAETSGILIEKAPSQVGFVHAIFGEHLAAFHLAARPLSEQAQFVTIRFSEPRWRNVILSLFRMLTRPSDVDYLVDRIPAAVGSEGEVSRLLLLAEVAFGENKRSARVAKQIAAKVFDRIETGLWMPEREALLRIVMEESTGTSLFQDIHNRLWRWYPETQWSRESTYEVLGSWTCDQLLYETLWRGLFDSKLSNQRGAARAIASAFKGDESMHRRLVAELHKPQEAPIAAFMLNALCAGWPTSLVIPQMLDIARRSRAPILSIMGICCAIKMGLQTDEDRETILRLANWDTPDIYDLRAEIVRALVSGWPNDKAVYSVCLSSWTRDRGHRGDVDFDIAQSVLLEGFAADDQVIRHLCELVTGKEFGFRGFGDPWQILRKLYRRHNVIGPILDDRIERQLKESMAWIHETAFAATVSGSDRAKKQMIALLPDAAEMVFWPVWALLDAWGMGDSEVAEALVAIANGQKDRVQYFAQHIPEIMGKTPSCRTALLEVANLPAVARPDFVVQGLAKLGPEYRNLEVIDAALSLMIPGQPLFDPTPHIIAHFGSDSRVRNLAISLVARCGAPLAAIAYSYRDDPEIRRLVLDRMAPLPDNLREIIIDQAARRPVGISIFHDVLSHYEDEREAPVRTAAEAAYYAALSRASTVEKIDLNRIIVELRSIGPEMDTKRQSALAGLLNSEQFSLFAGLEDRNGGRALRVAALSGSIHRNDRLLEQIAMHWRRVNEILGNVAFSRLSSWGEGDPTEAWNLLAPFINTSTEAVDAFLDYCRQTGGLLKADSLRALSRLQPGGALTLEICKRILISEGDQESFSPYDMLAARITAGQIVGTTYNSESSGKTLLEAVAGRPCSGGIIGLCLGWPDSKMLDEVFASLQSERRSHLAWPAVLHVYRTRADADTFQRVLVRLINSSSGDIWNFLPNCVDAIVRRLSIDDALYRGIILHLRGEPTANEVASLPRLMDFARSGEAEIRNWCTDELKRQTHDTVFPTCGLDLVAGRIRSVAQSLLDVIAFVA